MPYMTRQQQGYGPWYPRSSVPTVDSIEDAEIILDVAQWTGERCFNVIGKAARNHIQGILKGIIAERAIIDIPSRTQNPRHQLMMLASIFTQYEINR